MSGAKIMNIIRHVVSISITVRYLSYEGQIGLGGSRRGWFPDQPDK